MPDHDLIGHLARGLHSRIPECCVHFYILNFDAILELNEQRHRDYPDAGSTELDQGYVMCPHCWFNHTEHHIPHAQIHVCIPSDPICRLLFPHLIGFDISPSIIQDAIDYFRQNQPDKHHFD